MSVLCRAASSYSSALLPLAIACTTLQIYVLPQCLTTIAVPALLQHSSISICSHSICLTYISSWLTSWAGHCYARPKQQFCAAIGICLVPAYHYTFSFHYRIFCESMTWHLWHLGFALAHCTVLKQVFVMMLLACRGWAYRDKPSASNSWTHAEAANPQFCHSRHTAWTHLLACPLGFPTTGGNSRWQGC